MDVTIVPGTLKGAVTPPPSKSQAHRLILAAALSGGVSTLSNVDFSQDIEAPWAVWPPWEPASSARSRAW